MESQLEHRLREHVCTQGRGPVNYRVELVQLLGHRCQIRHGLYLLRSRTPLLPFFTSQSVPGLSWVPRLLRVMIVWGGLTPAVEMGSGSLGKRILFFGFS